MPNLLSSIRKRLRPRHLVEITTDEELLESTHWIDKPPLRLSISPQMLRMQGAYAFREGHPFIDALKSGRGALERFYSVTQPKNVAELYGIDAAFRLGANLPAWEIPWYLRKERTPPPGEKGLAGEHGVSFYGPATKEKVALEFRRLTDLRSSISLRGYDPDLYGDIEGYVLRSGGEACFFVRGGKHRAAVLVSLGYERIPVAFRSSFPRLVDRDQAEFWPLVKSGQMDIGLAQDILAAYTTNNYLKAEKNE
jgi:hypothetical protein